MSNFQSIEQKTAQTTNLSYASLSQFRNFSVSSAIKQLTIFQNNVRGLNDYNYFTELRLIFSQLPIIPDILVLSEVKLKATTQISLYHMDCYELFACLRDSQCCGGGLLVYIKSGINAKVVENISTSFEKIILKLNYNDVTINLISIYRPPVTCNCTEFFTSLEKSLEECHGHVIIVGDINIDPNANLNESMRYKNLLTHFAIAVTNNLPTRPSSGRVIDHFACNFSDSYSIINHTVNQDTYASDHSMIISQVNIKSPKRSVKTVSKNILDFSKLSLSFRAKAGGIINETDPNEIATKIIKATNDAISENTTTISVKLKNHQKAPPWLTGELLICMRNKDKWHEKLQKHPESIRNKEEYAAACMKFRSLNEKLRIRFHNKYFNALDRRKCWNGIKKLTGTNNAKNDIKSIEVDGKLVSNSIDICNAFNEFLTTFKVECNTNHIPPHESYSPNLSSLYLFPTNNTEVSDSIKKLKTNSAAGIDGISPKIVKTLRYELVPLFVHLINQIFVTCNYPDVFKNAIVILIHKAGDVTARTNYRPISILTSFNKIVERIIHERITNFIMKHNILIDRQFGFRKNSGTESAVIELLSTIQSELNTNNIVSAIFIDLQKAFDLVQHDVLLNILDKYGIRGNPNLLIKNYLSERKQYVRIGNTLSSPATITQGVVQGSIIGPLLFLLIINGIGHLSTKGKTIAYADDAVILHTHKKSSNITPAIVNDMNIIINFFNNRKLSLNESKTVYMTFYSPFNKDTFPESIPINQTFSLKNVSSFKYLGLYLDQSLTFNLHAKHLEKKTSPAVGILWKLRKDLPLKHREMIYEALIKSHYLYLITCWGSASHNTIKQLQTIQNRAIRNVYKLDHRHNRCEMYIKYNKLPIRGLCFQRTAIFTYRALNELTHSTIAFDHRLHPRHGITIIQSHPNNNYGVKNITCIGPRIFNNLPLIIRNATNLHDFIVNLNKYIIQPPQIAKFFEKKFLNIMSPY